MGNRATFFSSIGDIAVNLAFVNNFSATTNPGSSNDSSSSQNYRRGSVWINTLTNEAFLCTNDTVGNAVWELMTTGSATPGQVVAPAASTTTGNGSSASVLGGTGGSTSGNGGSVVLQGGQVTSGTPGSVRELGLVMRSQGAAVAHNAAATLAATDLIAGIITSGPSAGINLQLPLATAMDTAIPDAVAGDSLDFSIINTASGAGDIPTVTTNTGWTLVGTMAVGIIAAGAASSGRFRAAKTAAGAWTLFRIS